MYFRPMPADWKYWLDGADLRLSPGAMIPTGKRTWSYATVTASEAALNVFLGEAEAAGMLAETSDAIRREQGLVAL